MVEYDKITAFFSVCIKCTIMVCLRNIHQFFFWKYMQSMKQKARAYAEKFSWDDCFKRQLELYRQICNKNRE